MLIVSAITFAISWGGVRPSEINVAGIKIGEWQESLLLSFTALILSYLIGNFALVAKPEFETWSDELERFKFEMERVVRTATAQIQEGMSQLVDLVEKAQITGDFAAHVESGKPLIKDWLEVYLPRRKAEFINMHRARIRFEYRVPVAIAFIVLFSAIVRIALIAG